MKTQSKKCIANPLVQTTNSMTDVALSRVSTKDLVQELMCRPGVQCKREDPYAEYTVSGTGPAVILIVED